MLIHVITVSLKTLLHRIARGALIRRIPYRLHGSRLGCIARYQHEHAGNSKNLF